MLTLSALSLHSRKARLIKTASKKMVMACRKSSRAEKSSFGGKGKKSAGFIESQDSHQQLRALVVFLLEVMLRFFAARRRNGAHNSERHSGKINTLHEGEWYLMYCGK